jgi:hypothetical protein
MSRLSLVVLIFLGLAAAAPAKGPASVRSLPANSAVETNSTVVPLPGPNAAAPLYVNNRCASGCYDEDRRGFFDKIWTDPIAAFTAVLAVSTIALWWVTRSMANTSKRALLDLERPIVYGGVSDPGMKVEGQELKSQHLRLSIYNHGRTMARLRRIEWEVRTAPKGGIADPIDPKTIGGRELPAGTVCVSGDPYGEEENLFAKFSLDEAASIAALKLSVWVVGFVRYDDIFGRHHISGFTQVFDAVGEQCVRRGSDAYNYEREERAEDIPPPSSKG